MTCFVPRLRLRLLQRVEPVYLITEQLHTLVKSSTVNNVTTLTMNNPEKCNKWSVGMLDMLYHKMELCARDQETKVIILTGADPYYSSGGDISGYMKIQHPAKFHSMIVQNNYKMFDTFISYPKPILVAANGPAIGGAVTTAALCDGIVASKRASFLTPFSRMCVPPEGCSSHTLPRIMGDQVAREMLEECKVVSAEEAEDAGLVMEVVEHEKLLEVAQEVGEEWIRKGKQRKMMSGGTAEEYSKLNAQESIAVADAFLSYDFMNAQFDFLWGKGKISGAVLFWTFKSLRPFWINSIK